MKSLFRLLVATAVPSFAFGACSAPPSSDATAQSEGQAIVLGPSAPFGCSAVAAEDCSDGVYISCSTQNVSGTYTFQEQAYFGWSDLLQEQHQQNGALQMTAAGTYDTYRVCTSGLLRAGPIESWHVVTVCSDPLLATGTCHLSGGSGGGGGSGSGSGGGTGRQ
jgi:hypothetical protein